MKRFRSRVSRDSYPNFPKLVWMARHTGAKGQAAMAVLQDAIMIHYPNELSLVQKRAMKSALRRDHNEHLVVFSTPIETRLQKKQPISYRQEGWPLDTETPSRVTGSRENVIVVWSTKTGFDVHRWVKSRKNDRVYLSEAELDLLYNARFVSNGSIAVEPKSHGMMLVRRLLLDGYVKPSKGQYFKTAVKYDLTAKGRRKADQIVQDASWIIRR